MTATAPRARCDVCDQPLSIRTDPRKTGCCSACLRAGGAFLVNWVEDLRAAGHRHRDIAAIAGITINVSRSRSSERRRGLI